MTIRWFGKMYTAPVYFDCPEATTPAGAECVHCAEIIGGQDDGFIDSGGNPFHRECWVRMCMGSVAHIEGRCSCFGGSPDHSDPPGLTTRQAAQAALEAWEKQGYQGHST